MAKGIAESLRIQIEKLEAEAELLLRHPHSKQGDHRGRVDQLLARIAESRAKLRELESN
jgi:hypothetical protein